MKASPVPISKGPANKPFCERFEAFDLPSLKPCQYASCLMPYFLPEISASL